MDLRIKLMAILPLLPLLASSTPSRTDAMQVAQRATPKARAAPLAPAETLAVFARGLTAGGASAMTASTATGGTPTVVLLPGPIGSAYSMRQITSALSERGIPWVVIDPLGMGASSKPTKADYTLAGQARRIATVLDTLHVNRFVLVASGNSATIAYNMAADQPARVSAVLSLAGGPIDRQSTSLIRVALIFAPLLDNAMGRAIGRRKFERTVREQSVSDAWCTPDVVRAYVTTFERDMRASMRALRGMNDAVEPATIASRLTRIQAPVRLLVGEKHASAAPTDEEVALMQRSLAHFHVDTIPQSGTLINEERADAVVKAIVELLPPRATPVRAGTTNP